MFGFVGITVGSHVLALGASFLTPIVHGTAPQEQASPSVGEVLSRWERIDLPFLDVLLSAVHDPDATVESVRETLGPDGDELQGGDIGFGARRVQFVASANGYCTAYVGITVIREEAGAPERLVELRLAVWCGSDIAESLLFERTGNKLGSRATQHCTADIWYLTRRNEPAYEALTARIARDLGAAPKVEVPPELAFAFEILQSPNEWLALGRKCGLGSDSAPGEPEVEALVRAGRFDLLRAVLRGLNPEGRAWAAHALIKRARPGGLIDADDQRAIEKLATLPLEIETCHGCIFVRVVDLATALARLDTLDSNR